MGNRAQIAQRAVDLNPDLFHVHEPELLGPIVARSGGRPVVWDVHESYLDVLMDRDWIPRPLRTAARLAWDRRERALLRRCSAVVAATDRVAHRYIPLHRDVVTVANYPDLDELAGLPTAERDGKTLVYAGTIVPNRGLREVFSALALLRDRGVEVRLTLAGRGEDEYLRTLFGEAERLGVRHLVNYHGVVSRTEAIGLQNSSSIGIISGLPVGNNLAAVPVKMVECMALGLPLVYSDFPSHAEVAGRSQAGIAVDPTRPADIAAAIERLVRNPGLARELGENGRRGAREKFNWGAERAKLLELYGRILGPTRAR
jgi:glycosyltransferase involved in cell wall biosynthesis